jgi:ATP-dependent RNA helicase DHX37/DHR1
VLGKVILALDCYLDMPPKPIQQIYNVKGRQSTGGTRKKGKNVKKRRLKAPGDASDGEQQNQDANADILVPKSKDEKEKERKAKLLHEVRLSHTE